MPSYKDKLPIQTTINFDTIPTIGSTNAVTSGGIYNSLLSKQDVLTNPVTGTGTAGQVAYFSGTSTVTGSANLFWDAVNNRLGIGTNAPSVTYTQSQLHGVFARYEVRNSNANQNMASWDVYTNTLVTPDFFGRTSFKFEGGINNASRQYQIYVSDISTPKIAINGSGNVMINSIVDAGQRLQVYGSTLLRGSGTTSATTALLVQNSTPSELFKITDDGVITLGNTTAIFNTGSRTTFSSIGGANVNQFRFTATNTLTSTSGSVIFSENNPTFNPTSGTATLAVLNLNPTINQTGGANGITRGLYVNPTLTAAADWRSVEFSNNTGWGIYGAGTANNYLAGGLGIGTTNLSSAQNLNIFKNVTGAASVSSIQNIGIIQNDVTSSYIGISNSFRTAAATFNIADVILYNAGASLIGAGSTATNVTGYTVSDFGFGTNNFGFRGRILSGSGRWNLYMDGTAANYLAGNTSIGTTTESARLLVRGSGTTSATTALLVQNSGSTDMFSIDDIGVIRVRSQLITFAGVTTPFTILHRGDITDGVLFGQNSDTTITSGNRNTFSITESFIPTSGTATLNILRIAPTINQTGGANGVTRGLYVNPALTSAADWRTIEFSNSTGWGIYGAGSANNYLAGRLAIGFTSAIVGSNFGVSRSMTGATTWINILSIPQINSDVTSNAYLFRSRPTTQAASFTLSNLTHYSASQSTIGLGSSVTSQSGFQVESSLTGATNNYGFYGDIASGTGRWNLYMNGTASNYLAGDTSIGTTTSSGRLTVRGSGTTSATNGLLVEDSAGTDTFTIRDDGGYAFRNGTVGLAQTGYTTFTNLTTDRTCDANATTVEELADILGTLIEDLKTKGIIAA